MAELLRKYIFYVAFIHVLSLVSSVEPKIVKHTFLISYFEGSPDGVLMRKILGINQQFPGPTIEAVVGDTIQVKVINRIQDQQNTTIHWHGIHQTGSPSEDGPSMISQCPIQFQQTQLYNFVVNQAGTYWYHSHVGSQYTQGLWGALIIHNKPEVYTYDDEIVLTLSDWYHLTAKENEEWYLSEKSDGFRPYPDSMMINGFGRYPCNIAEIKNRQCQPALQKRPVFHLIPGKTYRIRVINTSSQASFDFSIDGHLLQTIEVDGTDVSLQAPAEFVVPIAPGQRYSFLTTHNGIGLNERHLIRANATHFVLSPDPKFPNLNKFTNEVLLEATAVLNYETGSAAKVQSTTETFDYTETLRTKEISSLAVLFDDFKLTPYDMTSAPSFNPDMDQEFLLHTTRSTNNEGPGRGLVTRLLFNETKFKLPMHKPVLHSILDNDPIPGDLFALTLDHHKVVQIVINNRIGGHPFHLHGHTFWVLWVGNEGEGDFNAKENMLKLTGPKKDTVFVPNNSSAVIRFTADNPGVWTFHCHIDWHNLAGMALVFIEAPDEIRRNLRITPEHRRLCVV